MSGFNLSDWALKHRSFVWFLMIVSLVAGAMAYVQIGREEDPNFAIKTMVVSAALPGASVVETLNQVTDRIEKKLEDLDELDKTRSITRPGQAVVYVELLDTTRAEDLPEIWQRVRNMMADIRGEFPAGLATCSATFTPLPRTGSPRAKCATMSRKCAARCRRCRIPARLKSMARAIRWSTSNSRPSGWRLWG